MPTNQKPTGIDKDGLEDVGGYYMGYNKTFGWTPVYAGYIGKICSKAKVNMASNYPRKVFDINIAIGERGHVCKFAIGVLFLPTKKVKKGRKRKAACLLQLQVFC